VSDVTRRSDKIAKAMIIAAQHSSRGSHDSIMTAVAPAATPDGANKAELDLGRSLGMMARTRAQKCRMSWRAAGLILTGACRRPSNFVPSGIACSCRLHWCFVCVCGAAFARQVLF
jgi:hypothetical protein